MKCPAPRAWLPLPLVLLVALAASAVMHDDDLPGPEPPDICTEPSVGITGTLHPNGLPVIQQQLEVVGDSVKVVVETTPRCHVVTRLELPFSRNPTR